MQERLRQLSADIEARRRITHRLHDEWRAACEALHVLEREQISVRRKMIDASLPNEEL